MTQYDSTGYLAHPRNGHGPGVLVLHAWWGLNATIRNVCDQLAHEGFTAYAPDLYHGKLATTIAEAKALSGQADEVRIKAELALAVDHLCAHAQRQEHGVAVIGFSFGAYFALGLSADDPERVHSVALFYGNGEGDFKRARARYQGHFAALDSFEPAEGVDALEHALKTSGREVEFHRYPGVGHWFFEPDRTDAYNSVAAQLAWQRTMAFLQQAMSPVA